MNQEYIDVFFMNDEREKQIWQDCLFIFDTSTLLDFYFFSKQSQLNIFTNIFEKIKNRLWIPQHVEFEYLKNRVATLKKPVNEKYMPIQSEIIKQINEDITSLGKRLDDFENRTKNKDTHPFIEDDEIINSIKTHYKTFCEQITSFNENKKTQIDTRIHEINQFTTNDEVLSEFKKYFQVGEEYHFDKLLEIAAKGEQRFIANIPPGYKDAHGSKSKDGMQKYGDLIIWNQIIDIAKNNGRPIIFVVNDNKEDWCYFDKETKRIIRPREELIKELKDKAQVSFWMYNLSEFLYKTTKLLNSQISEAVLEESRNVRTVKSVSYNGFYIRELKVSTQYIRFFSDGKVVSASVKGKNHEIDRIAKWLNKDYNHMGSYTIEGTNIKFSITSSNGTVDYFGSIESSELLNISWYSHINGNSGLDNKYVFIPLS